MEPRLLISVSRDMVQDTSSNLVIHGVSIMTRATWLASKEGKLLEEPRCYYHAGRTNMDTRCRSSVFVAASQFHAVSSVTEVSKIELG